MKNLVFKAGKLAYEHLRKNGLSPNAVKIVAGAAGGPKWLVLSQLDRMLFDPQTGFFAHRQQPLFLLGSSIGAWRFAAVTQHNPLVAIERFESAYLEQRFTVKPSALEVSRVSQGVLDAFVTQQSVQEILEHPQYRINVLAGRCRGIVGSDSKAALGFGLGSAALLNVVSQRFVQWFFQRTLFRDPRTTTPFANVRSFACDEVFLQPENFKQAILASGSIPLVMAGVHDVPGALPGTYRDGGIVDYHMDVPYLSEGDPGLVLFPHFSERVVPGWFDKGLAWRKPNLRNMAHVLMVAPSREFIARLPGGKIPDRSDFIRYQGRDTERIAAWRRVLHECERLRDEFSEVLAAGRVDEVVELWT